ncbi:recombinase family protein [Orrella sp. JC864]|uniref:recombinase family protein n=1 Tax=Orrella sp. JC864 TaxID=3120298 RepID=UPI00300B4748
MHAAFYGRFSTDRQRETSIEDQERICAARAAALGLDLTIRHSDQGISGSTPVAARPGGKRLLADALAGRFDVLLVEGLDRLSRDMVEQEQTIRRFEHRGIRIIGVSDGYDSVSSARKLHRGMRGLINEVYLDDLRAKTHRGLRGQVDRGFHAGGLSYGYRSVDADGGKRLEVNPEQAGWVRWIFKKYSEGWSVQRIAHELNRLGVPALRGGTWAVSAIYGNPRRLAGVLNNELYIGRYIWNRSQWLKDPDTGQRIRVDRPREEWLTREVPELRIVDDATWEAVRERLSLSRTSGGPGKSPPPRTLLGGLLRCSLCGGAMVAINLRMYGCGAHKDRGPAVCRGTMTPRRETDKRLLDIIREELLSPAALAELQRQVKLMTEAIQRNGRQGRDAAVQRLAHVDAELDRLTDAIARLGFSEALADRLRAAEAERAKLKRALAESDQPPSQVQDAVERYRALLRNLESALASDIERARAILLQILGRPVISNDDDGTWATLESETTPLRVAVGAVSGCGCGDRI